MITVIRPGVLTTFQDAGRHGYAHLGVPGAGAADMHSLRIANSLVGNSAYAVALEITADGPTLRFEVPAAIAFSGARVTAVVDGAPVAMDQTLWVSAGQVLRVGRVSAGVRCYLAVRGGLDVPKVLGSASTDTLSGIGPPTLTRGRQLRIGRHAALVSGWYLNQVPQFPVDTELRVLIGPHDDWITAASRAAMVTRQFKVSAASDRTGIRLENTNLKRARQGELQPAGMVTGAIQLPPDGNPIILLPNHGTTGGYPVVATVISADISKLGQLREADSVYFKPVSRETATRALAEVEQDFRDMIVPADKGLLEIRSVMMLARDNPGVQELHIDTNGGHVTLRREP